MLKLTLIQRTLLKKIGICGYFLSATYWWDLRINCIFSPILGCERLQGWESGFCTVGGRVGWVRRTVWTSSPGGTETRRTSAPRRGAPETSWRTQDATKCTPGLWILWPNIKATVPHHWEMINLHSSRCFWETDSAVPEHEPFYTQTTFRTWLMSTT